MHREAAGLNSLAITARPGCVEGSLGDPHRQAEEFEKVNTRKISDTQDPDHLSKDTSLPTADPPRSIVYLSPANPTPSAPRATD